MHDDLNNPIDSSEIEETCVEFEAEYEEISSDEVDRIVHALESLIAETASENIRAYLDEAAENIYRLVYDDEDDQSANWDDETAEAA